jgi:dienelactone hydrolase
VRRPGRFSLGYAIPAAMLLAVSGLLAQAFGLPRLPAPSGPHPVGTVTSELQRPTDQGRRRLFLKIWYPADQATGKAEGLWSDLPAMTDIPWLVRGGLAYLSRATTHSHRSAPYAAGLGPTPVVLYNHSFESWASENSLLAEELASRGAVVVSIRHLGQVDEYRQLDGRLSTVGVASQIVDRRTADARLVADRLGAVLGAIPAMTHDRPRTYAAMGFSLGGAVSTRLCIEDRRCWAVVNIDGGVPGVDYTRLPIPRYLMIAGRRTIGVTVAQPAGTQSGYQQRIFPEAEHADFHDSAVVLPVTRWFFGRSVAELGREKHELAATVAEFLAKAVSGEVRPQ